MSRVDFSGCAGGRLALFWSLSTPQAYLPAILAAPLEPAPSPGPEPTETPAGKLMAAASFLAQAASGIIENALAERVFLADVAGYARNPMQVFPLGDELDDIAEAIMLLHAAIGEPNETFRLAQAAASFWHGED